jgi:hypothetical protein
MSDKDLRSKGDGQSSVAIRERVGGARETQRKGVIYGPRFRLRSCDLLKASNGSYGIVIPLRNLAELSFGCSCRYRPVIAILEWFKVAQTR